jgi:hypothetical protein
MANIKSARVGEFVFWLVEGKVLSTTGIKVTMRREVRKLEKKKMGTIALIAVIIVAVGVFFAPNVNSQQLTTLLYVSPAQVVYNTLTVGTRFDVNVTVANVTNLASIQFNMTFNPTELAVVSENFLPGANLPVPSWTANSTDGWFWANVTYSSTVSTTSPTALVDITFKISNYGLSPLNFASCILANTTSVLTNVQVTGGEADVLLHDVAMVGLYASTNVTYTGRVVNVTAVAQNLGMAPENFSVAILANSTVLGNYSVINLQPSATISFTDSWNTSGFAASSPYTIQAQASTVPNEANTMNNILFNGTVQVKILGDVNGDGVVNLADLIAWDAAYGSTPGSPNWNPQADILGDGVVDKADGICIIENYGNTAP